MSRIYLDFETRSELDLEIRGLDNYAQHASTKALMLAYAFDDGPVELWEPHLNYMPTEVREALKNPDIDLVSWNAAFERNIFRYVLNLNIRIRRWIDPMIQVRMMSMPGHLKDACRILGLPPELAKDPEGEKLIDFFCKPVNLGGEPTLFGISETFFRDWATHPKEWEWFKSYCRHDVIAMREIVTRLAAFPVPESEKIGWILDQEINERGLPVDMDLVRGATAISAWEKDLLRAELKTLTGLENPNSVQQMLGWVRERGYTFNAMAKPLVKRALDGECKLTPDCRKALLLRKQSGKTSDSKLDAIANNVSDDGRLRGQFAFLGASKTGRWASYDVQLANLPRPTKEVWQSLGLAIELLKNEDHLGLVLEFPNVMEVVTSCIRSMFKAPKYSRFIISDLNAIENRIIMWLSRCESGLEVFRLKRCPYLSFAAELYKTSYEALAAAYEAGDLLAKERRQQSKPAVLGAGYRLSGGEEAVNEDGDRVKTGLWGYAASMGIDMTRENAHHAVKVFRDKYKEVVNLWYALEDATKMAMMSGEAQQVGRCVIQAFGDKLLRILLPSGRGLHYIRPRLEMLPFRDSEKETLTYEGVDQKTKVWTRLKTHGGKLLENISQAVGRDILLHGMLQADSKGFNLVGHVHDEAIAEVGDGSPLTLRDLIDCLIAPPEWAKDLPLGAGGFESEVYRKE